MNKVFSSFSKLFLSLCGVGFIPFAPGTWGSVFAFLFLYAGASLDFFSFQGRLLLFFGIFVLLYVLSFYMIQIHKNKKEVDHSWIVIDEFLGMMVSVFPFFLFLASFWYWLLALVLFRVFDIFKPFGIQSIDEKKTAHSVLLDDIYAGVLTAIFISFFLIYTYSCF